MNKFIKFVLIGGLSMMGLRFVMAFGNPSTDRTDAAQNAEYREVYNADNVGHGAGQVVIYQTAGTYPGMSVTTTTSADSGLVAGVVVSSIAASSWGTIQVHGYNAAVKIGVANSAGDRLITSTTGGLSGVYTVAQSTTDFQIGVFAVALETTTSSTTVKALIKCE